MCANMKDRETGVGGGGDGGSGSGGRGGGGRKGVKVGSHDRRSLQLFPKMYYYLSPRSETTLPLKIHSTYVKNNHTM